MKPRVKFKSAGRNNPKWEINTEAGREVGGDENLHRFIPIYKLIKYQSAAFAPPRLNGNIFKNGVIS